MNKKEMLPVMEQASREYKKIYNSVVMTESHNEIRLTLPRPPSVNEAYSTNRRTGSRFKSQKYKDWVSRAEVDLMCQKSYAIEGDEWLEVEYKYYMPIYLKSPSKKTGSNKKVIDCFNYEKALSDFLADNIEGFADHKIKNGSVEKIHSARMEVEIVIREVIKQ